MTPGEGLSEEAQTAAGRTQSGFKAVWPMSEEQLNFAISFSHAHDKYYDFEKFQNHMCAYVCMLSVSGWKTLTSA